MSMDSIGDKEFEEPDYRDVFFIEEDAVLQTASLDKLGDTNSGILARLLGKHEFYLEVGASQYIIDSVESGYKLLFYDDQPPPKFFKSNNKSALDKGDFVLLNLRD